MATNGGKPLIEAFHETMREHVASLASAISRLDEDKHVTWRTDTKDASFQPIKSMQIRNLSDGHPPKFHVMCSDSFNVEYANAYDREQLAELLNAPELMNLPDPEHYKHTGDKKLFGPFQTAHEVATFCETLHLLNFSASMRNEAMQKINGLSAEIHGRNPAPVSVPG